MLDEDELGLDNELPETRLLEDPVADGRLVILLLCPAERLLL